MRRAAAPDQGAKSVSTRPGARQAPAIGGGVRRLGALTTMAVIGCGALLGGMDTAALAALLSAALAGLLALAILATPQARLIALARMHAAPVAAFILFAAWTLFTAQLTPAASAPAWLKSLFHPLWSAFEGPQAAISISPYRTLEGLASFAGPAAAFALGALCAEDRTDRDFIGRLMTGAALALGFWCLFLFATGAQTNNNRLMAPFGSSNAAATMFGLFALFACALILRASRERLSGLRRRAAAGPAWLSVVQQAPLSAAALGVMLACALLTGSRAGLAALAGGLVFFFALTRAGARGGRGGGAQGPAAFLAAITGILLLVGGDFLASRFGTFGVDAEGRRMMIETHWGAFTDRPFIGHGLNTFHELNAYYATVHNWPALRDIGAAHNIFVQLLEETGLLGAAFFFLMLAPPLARALQIAVEDRSGAEWAAASFAGAAFAFAHGLVDFGLQVPATAALMAFGLGAFSSARIDPRPPRRSAPPPEPDPRSEMRADEMRAAA